MTSPQSNLNKSNAPRDLATLCRAGRFMLRSLAAELGMFSDPAAMAAFQGAVTDEQARMVKEALDAYDRANGGAPQQGQPQQPPQMQQQPSQGFAPAPGFQPQAPQMQPGFNGGYPQQQPPQGAQGFAPPPQMQQNFQPPQMQQQAQQQNFQPPAQFVPPQGPPPNGFAANGGFTPPTAPQQGFTPPQPPNGFPQQPPQQQQPMFTAPQDQPAPTSGKPARKPRTPKNSAPAAESENTGHAEAPATTTPKELQHVLDGQREILDELEDMRKKNEVLVAFIYIILEGSFDGDISRFLNRANEISPALQDGITRLVGKGRTKS